MKFHFHSDIFGISRPT